MCIYYIISYFLKPNISYKNIMTQTELEMKNPIFIEKIYNSISCQTESIYNKLINIEDNTENYYIEDNTENYYIEDNNIEDWHKLIWVKN
jgi:hypothetical protein